MFHWLTGKDDRPPLLLKVRSSTTFIILTVCTAIFTDIFAYGIIVPVVPFALTERAGIAPDDVQYWISILLAIYGAALLVTAPFCGWLADRSSSRRLPLLVGLLALAASTVMLCVGNSIGVLAAGRALQGMSAAVVWVVGLALLADTVGGDEIGQVMGYVGLSMSLAILLSPLLAGVVFEKAGYYAVFAMCFGLIVLDILLRLIMVERKIAVQWIPEYAPKGEKARQVAPPADNRRSVATIEMDGDLSPSTAKPDDTTLCKSDHDTVPTPAAEPEVWGPPDQSKWYNRLPPVIRLLSSRRLVSALWACFIQASLLTSFDATLPLFVKNTFGWNSIGAGLIFLPICVPTFIGPVVGALSDKHGPRWYAVAGFLLSCPFLILLRLVGHNSMGQKVLLCALLALIGFALTLALTPMMAEITYAVVAKEARHPPGYFGKNGAFAQAYSLFNMAWAGGCLVGPLLAGLVVNASGWPLATLILGVVSLVTVVPTAVWTGGSIFKKRRKDREVTQAAGNAAGV
nr:hypothetical protein B0A51_15632 [Rachicladosporium sp. CCFEE 5018]